MTDTQQPAENDNPGATDRTDVNATTSDQDRRGSRMPLRSDESMLRWFGEPWGAPINEFCPQTHTPIGIPCGRCTRAIGEHDQGVYMLYLEATGHARKPLHLDCFLRGVLGYWPPATPGSSHIVPDEGEAPTDGEHPIWPYRRVRFTADGRIIGVLDLALGRGKIVVGEARGLLYTDEWMYPTLMDAVNAYCAWEGAAGTEPQGWTRHTSSREATRRPPTTVSETPLRDDARD